MSPATPHVDTPGWRGFADAMWRAASWRMFLLLQGLAFAYALDTWCQTVDSQPQPHMLSSLLVSRSLSALLVMVAALAADEAVRRGRPVWQALLAAVVLMSVGVTLVEWCVQGLSGYRDPGPPDLPGPFGAFAYGVHVFLVMTESWAMVVLVFLDRQSAARKMAGVRAAELQRVELESHVTASRLAAAGARLDPTTVFARLAQIRQLYATARPGADEKLEALIGDLQDSVRRGAVAGAGDMR